MDTPQINQDDLIDIIEMCDKLEKSIYRILNGTPQNLALSALVSSTINCLLAQCRSIDEIRSYRNILTEMFDASIKNAMESED